MVETYRVLGRKTDQGFSCDHQQVQISVEICVRAHGIDFHDGHMRGLYVPMLQYILQGSTVRE